jgi:hypothetical protein
MKFMKKCQEFDEFHTALSHLLSQGDKFCDRLEGNTCSFLFFSKISRINSEKPYKFHNCAFNEEGPEVTLK